MWTRVGVSVGFCGPAQTDSSRPVRELNECAHERHQRGGEPELAQVGKQAWPRSPLERTGAHLADAVGAELGGEL